MTLDELKTQASADLPITDQEHLDQESFRNQEIKAKWLDYKTRYELMVVNQMQKYMHLNHLTLKY